MLNNEAAELEEQRKNAVELVGRRDMALKLSSNREFRKLILEDYCVIDAARLVGLSTDPSLTLEQRADSLAMAQGPGFLRRFLSMMVVMGNNASKEVGQIDDALNEIRAADLDDAAAESTVEVLN